MKCSKLLKKRKTREDSTRQEKRPVDEGGRKTEGQKNDHKCKKSHSAENRGSSISPSITGGGGRRPDPKRGNREEVGSFLDKTLANFKDKSEKHR